MANQSGRIIGLALVVDEDDPQCAMVQAVGRVNGVETRFMVDTGAALTHVVEAEHLGFGEPVRTHSSHGVFGSATRPIHQVSSIAFDELTWRDVEVVLEQPEEWAQSLLGMDLLGRHTMLFDFASRRLVLDGSEPNGPFFDLSRSRGGHLEIQAQLGDTSVNCVWDSGAGMTVVDESFWSAHREHFIDAGVSEGTDATGRTMVTTLFDITGLRIGDRKFDAHHAVVVDLSHANATQERPMELILGFPTLRQASWYFDVSLGRWSFCDEN